MKVKICGLHPVRDVQLCIDLGVNFLGFVFYKKSPRNLIITDVPKLKSYNKKDSSFVAVTVDPSDKFINEIVMNNFEYIQLHGSESKERVKEIKKTGLKIIKTIKVQTESDIYNYRQYDFADIILFDTPSMEKSKEFPIDLISKIPKGDKYAVAGSVSLNNIDNIAKLGVNFCDLSSSLELDKQIGYKDHLKIKKFIKKINEFKN